jgi:hypothetical protein
LGVRVKILVLFAGLLVAGMARAGEPVVIGVMELEGKAGFSQERADALADMLAEEISRMGDIRVVGKSDILTMLALEKQKRLAGCSDTECMSEVGKVLGMRWMVAGNISLFGKTYLINLKLFDMESALVLGRVTRKVRGGDEELLEELPTAVQELFDRVSGRLGLHTPDRVTAAARHPQPITESPSSVIVITRRDIEESGATTFMELLRRYPAIHVYMFDPLFPLGAIRGTTLILLLLDGREVNTEFFPHPFYAALPVGLNDIERIEIVLGPGSALYGANAVAAVVNVVTRHPGTILGADLFYASGEHGASILEGAARGGLGPLALRASFGLDRANSWMNRGLMSKRIERANATVHMDFRDGAVALNGGVSSGAGRLFSSMGYLDFASFLLAHLMAKIELGKLKSQVSWYGVRTKADLELDIVHPEMDITLGTIPRFHLDGDTLQAEAQYELELFQNNLLIAGADFRFTSYRSDQFVDPRTEEYRVGVFLHDEHRFGQRILLTAGARFDWNSVTDPAISPRATLVVSPAADHFLRLSAGVAFRKPTILETSANFKIDADPAFENEMKVLFEEQGLSNSKLPNEILTSLEAGYRSSFFEKTLRLGSDVYFDMRRRRISFTTDIHFNELMQIDLDRSRIGFENIGEDFNIIGVNLRIEGDPSEELTLFLRGELRYRWEVESGKEHKFTPNLLASAGATLRLPFGLTVHSAMVFVDDRLDDVRNPESSLAPQLVRTLPAHAYLLCALAYRLPVVSHRVELGLSLFNPFGGRFRETTGVRAPDGSNYGGELLGTRAMLTARLVY